MRLLLYRNCQMLSVFSFEPSIGVSSLPCWNLEALRGLWCLRVWKKNKCIRSSNDSPLFPCILIFTMPRPAVKLWKWGPKYLKEEIRCWESSPATLVNKNEGFYSCFSVHGRRMLLFIPFSPLLNVKLKMATVFCMAQNYWIAWLREE